MHNQSHDTRSVLARLRSLPHERAATSDHTMRAFAERQARQLRYLTSNQPLPVDRLIATMPSIRVVADDIPTSGLSHWNGRQWIITINIFEPRTRQRFTILHEFKHIIDHPDVEALYRDRHDASAAEQMEQAANYFAGCALVPTDNLVDLWQRGTRRSEALAQHFDVSVPAIEVRLRQARLSTSFNGPSATYARTSSSHSERLSA